MDTIDLQATLTPSGLLDLESSLDRAAASTGPLVLRGAGGGVFSQGMDTVLAGCAPDDARVFLVRFARCLGTLRLLGRPTLAVVDGVALGGGLGLAAACDLIIATSRATFGLPELLMGLVPAIVTRVLLERVSAQQVRRMALQARTFSAHEVATLGLVDEVVEPGDLELTVRRLVRQLGRPESEAVSRFKMQPDLLAELEQAAANTADLLGREATRRRLRALDQNDVVPWQC